MYSVARWYDILYLEVGMEIMRNENRRRHRQPRAETQEEGEVLFYWRYDSEQERVIYLTPEGEEIK